MKNPKSLLTCAMMMIALISAAPATQAATPGNSASTASDSTAGTVNINTATAGELMKLPGIGKSKADAIVQYRTTAKFDAVDDLQAVRGIGPKMFEQLRPYVRTEGATTLQSKPASKRAPTSALPLPTTGGLV